MDAMNYTDNYTVTGPPENEEHNDQIEEASDVTKITIVSVNVIIFLFSFVGNSLVIHLVRTRKKIRKNPFNWLLVNTGVADLVEVITALVINLSFFFVGNRWIPGTVGTILCKIIPFFLAVSICASIWTLTVMAADRYVAIVRMQNNPLSSRSAVRSIIAVWLCAGLVFSGELYKFKNVETDDGYFACYHQWHEDSEEMNSLLYKVEIIGRVVIIYAVPFVIMAVLYSLIAYFLWRHKPPGHVNQLVYAKQARQRRAVIKKMTTAVMVMALLWLPVHVSHIMTEFYLDAYASISPLLTWLFFSLAYANAAIDPWLFIVFSENLRVETKEIFRKICKGKRVRFEPQHFINPRPQTLGFTYLELTASTKLAPSRSSLGTLNLATEL